MPQIDQFKIVKVIYAADLENLTRQGWRLIQVLSEDQITPTTEQQLVQPCLQSGGYSNPATTMSVTRNMVINVPKFLVGLDEKEAAALVNQELESLRKNRETLAATSQKLEGDNVTLVKEAIELKQNLSTAITAADHYKGVLNKAVSEKTELETQLRKVRVAIGEKTMNEILG